MIATRHIYNLSKIKYYNRLTPLLKPPTVIDNDKPLHHSTIPKVVTKKSEDGLVTKILSKIPFLDLNKIKLRASGYLLYESVADRINYLEFFESLKLPDTFNTWFVLTELHVWMVLARVMAEGDDGKYVRNYIVQAMWDDVNTRVKKLGAGFAQQIRNQISEMSEQFQAAIIAYDEGLQTNDKLLANALWRRLFQQECDDPEKLELVVSYVRKQMQVLDELSSEEVLYECKIPWSPLQSKKV